MRRQRAAAWAALALTATLTAACGGGGEPSGPTTVTVTPTVTATGDGEEAAPSTSETTAAGPPKSGVKGRAYDLGTITETATVDGVQVATLDRWTVKGLDDAKLATDGYPVRLIAKSPFSNQNATLVYAVPLAETATVLYHHCLAADQPVQTKSSTIAELSKLADQERVVLATLDERGYATSIENYPVC